MRCQRLGVPQQQNEEHFSRLEIQLYIVHGSWFKVKFFVVFIREARAPRNVFLQ